jgi:hypothetical protein
MSGAGEPRRAGRWFGVFGGPIIIGVLSLAGLLSALLLGDAGRVFSWIAVGCPIAVSAWFLFRARRSARREEPAQSPF